MRMYHKSKRELGVRLAPTERIHERHRGNILVLGQRVNISRLNLLDLMATDDLEADAQSYGASPR